MPKFSTCRSPWIQIRAALVVGERVVLDRDVGVVEAGAAAVEGVGVRRHLAVLGAERLGVGPHQGREGVVEHLDDLVAAVRRVAGGGHAATMPDGRAAPRAPGSPPAPRSGAATAAHPGPGCARRPGGPAARASPVAAQRLQAQREEVVDHAEVVEAAVGDDVAGVRAAAARRAPRPGAVTEQRPARPAGGTPRPAPRSPRRPRAPAASTRPPAPLRAHPTRPGPTPRRPGSADRTAARGRPRRPASVRLGGAGRDRVDAARLGGPHEVGVEVEPQRLVGQLAGARRRPGRGLGPRATTRAVRRRRRAGRRPPPRRSAAIAASDSATRPSSKRVHPRWKRRRHLDLAPGPPLEQLLEQREPLLAVARRGVGRCARAPAGRAPGRPGRGRRPPPPPPTPGRRRRSSGRGRSRGGAPSSACSAQPCLVDPLDVVEGLGQRRDEPVVLAAVLPPRPDAGPRSRSPRCRRRPSSPCRRDGRRSTSSAHDGAAVGEVAQPQQRPRLALAGARSSRPRPGRPGPAAARHRSDRLECACRAAARVAARGSQRRAAARASSPSGAAASAWPARMVTTSAVGSAMGLPRGRRALGVQPHPAGRAEVVEQGLAGQRVGEPEARPGPTSSPEATARSSTSSTSSSGSPETAATSVGVDDLAQHRRLAEQGAGLRRQPAQPLPQHVAYAVRHG